MRFLEAVAAHYAAESGEVKGDTCFVFPNRRSALFFRQYLVKLVRGTNWVPPMLTINELMPRLAGMELADPLDLLFALYDIYVTRVSKPEPFDSFYPWGEMMISDFDTLDKYLADPSEVFRNISELKEIDDTFGGLDEEQVAFIRRFWKGFLEGGPTTEKEIFLSTWRLLPVLYNELKAWCMERGTGYEGLIYRLVATAGIDMIDSKLESRHYAFIGFNALSNSEKKLLSMLQKRGAASFFWDYDDAWINDSSMEAGRFMRENIRQFPPKTDLGLSGGPAASRQVRIFDVPSDILQAKTVHRILSEKEGRIRDASDTAVIACDENLLMPVLASLPPSVETVNITMGYPFSNTPLNSFVERILGLYRHARVRSDRYVFYYKDVLSVLNHQYYRLISSNEPGETVRQITRENRVYLEPDFFGDGLAGRIFSRVETVDALCGALENILGYILERLMSEEEHQYRELEKEYVLVMKARLNKLRPAVTGRDGFGITSFIRLFRRVMAGQRIPFTGEPLAGLQVMGILETRLLDFDHVIMLSVNDDVMPGNNSGNSFIPPSLRYAYGLPVREDMDAIYAYYFFRIIRRAGKVDLLFRSASEGIRSGEMSRYLYQMKYNYNAQIISPVMEVTAPAKTGIHIEKTPEILEILGKYLSGNAGDRYLSPSALNMYIECPLRFYFRKVAGVGEQQGVLEELDAIGYGNVLHKTIQKLYAGITQVDHRLDPGVLKELKRSEIVRETLEEVFRKEYFGPGKNRPIEGQNLIIFHILEKQIRKIIEMDEQTAPIEILGLEKMFIQTRRIFVADRYLEIQVGGVVDRIDRPENGNTRIIDYKTGNVSQQFESVDALFDPGLKGRSKEAFQALVYASLYLLTNPGEPVTPGLYVTRELYSDAFNTHFRMGPGRNKEPLIHFGPYFEVFLRRLDDLVTEIFDPEVPFVQTSIPDRCKYCDFRQICERE